MERGPVGVVDRGRQHHALDDRGVGSEHDSGVLLEALPVELGQEPEPAEVDADQRQRVVDRATRLAEQRAVAPQHEGEVHVEVIRKRLAVGGDLGGDVGPTGDAGANIVQQVRDLWSGAVGQQQDTRA